VLQILYAALSEYGCPEIIVSDNARVFKAKDYEHILDVLEIEPKYIEKGKPWQNLIEAQFKV
jgi:transposase InsO family protein